MPPKLPVFFVGKAPLPWVGKETKLDCGVDMVLLLLVSFSWSMLALAISENNCVPRVFFWITVPGRWGVLFSLLLLTMPLALVFCR
jgi:hypothetical protein